MAASSKLFAWPRMEQKRRFVKPFPGKNARTAHLETATNLGRAKLLLCRDFSPARSATVGQEETWPTLKREIGAARQRTPYSVEASGCAPSCCGVSFFGTLSSHMGQDWLPRLQRFPFYFSASIFLPCTRPIPSEKWGQKNERNDGQACSSAAPTRSEW